MFSGKKKENTANSRDVYTKSKRRQFYRTVRTLAVSITVPLLIGAALSIVIYRHYGF